MDDIRYFEKLKYEQDRVLKDNQDAQKTRGKLKEDYLKLQTKLQTLPDVVSEDAMVPIGNVAFFPGHLIHTNEIMVLLGDNWFVERSTKQAIEIIERRLKMVEKQLSDLQKEETRIKDQKDYTNEFFNVKKEVGDIKEIQEEITDEPLSKIRTATSRKAHMAKHNQVPRTVKFKDADQLVQDISKDASKNNSDTIDHDELFARLNELEKEEQEQEEKMHAEQMKQIYNGEYTRGSKKDVVKAPHNNDMESNNGRHVKFKNDLKSCASKSYDSDDEPSSSRNVISITHTPYHQRERSASESDIRNTINSPADVFEQFASRSQDSSEKLLKSILKKDSRSNSNENLKLKPILKTSPEHQPGTPELSFDDRRPILKTPPDSQGSDRRPGTPEYMLSDDRKSILKSNNGNMNHGVVTVDVDTNEPRPILKFLDTQLDNTNDICDTNGEEMRSILKPCGENTSPEHALSHEDISGGMRQENRRPILKSPDNVRSTKLTNETFERKTILKNTGNDALSDRVMERTDYTPLTNTPMLKQLKTSEHRPVSKFKASRSGR